MRPNSSDHDPLAEHAILPQERYAELDPDELKGNGERAQSIIYTDRLYLDPDYSGRSHVSFFNRGMSKTAKDMQADLSRHLDMGGFERKGQPKGWFSLYDKFLFGRLANYDGRRVISFWGRGQDLTNPQAKGPTHLIPDCVQALYYKDVVDQDTLVIYGDGRTSTVGEVLDGAGPGEEQIDPEAVRRAELARRMHLAGSAEKKQIRKQLGVGGGGSEKRDPWDDALQKLPQDRGGLAPGQNKWRMTSESRQRALDAALDRIR